VKDTVITGKQKIRELWILGTCFILANALNVLGIIINKTNWNELFSQLHVVLLVTVFLYLVAGIIRLAAIGIKQLAKRPRN
jgi:hypothetical protein